MEFGYAVLCKKADEVETTNWVFSFGRREGFTVGIGLVQDKTV